MSPPILMPWSTAPVTVLPQLAVLKVAFRSRLCDDVFVLQFLHMCGVLWHCNIIGKVSETIG